MIAKISLSLNNENSSSPICTGVPPNCGNRTLCPAVNAGFTNFPVSSIPPGPTASTVPSFNFCVDFSGINNPEAVFVSAFERWIRILFRSGCIDFADLMAVDYSQH